MVSSKQAPHPKSEAHLQQGRGVVYYNLIMKAPLLSIAQETRVLALIARGDTVTQIVRDVGFHINPKTVTAIRKRNKDNLAIIAEKMLVMAAEDAAAIKQKANKKISTRLDQDDKHITLLQKAEEDYLAGNITFKDYMAALKSIHELSVSELVSVSREMHNQSTEPDKPKATPADLAALTEAIRSGDEVKITQAVFNGGRNTSP